MEEVHTFSRYNRFLGILQNMRESVEPFHVIEGVNAHCLFTHCTLVYISG